MCNENMRKSFEKKFPVPKGIIWSGNKYVPDVDDDFDLTLQIEMAAIEHQTRLETWQAALTQQPESEPALVLHAYQSCDSGELLFNVVRHTGLEEGTHALYTSPQPAPQGNEYEHLHNTIALLTKQLAKAEKSPQVPEGWQTVPREMTPEMWDATNEAHQSPCSIWHAALTAAPSIAEGRKTSEFVASATAWVRFQAMLADDDPAKDHSIAQTAPPQVPEGWKTIVTAPHNREIEVTDGSYVIRAALEEVDYSEALDRGLLGWVSQQFELNDNFLPTHWREVSSPLHVAAAPSIAEEREWISCKERLPMAVDGDLDDKVWFYSPEYAAGIGVPQHVGVTAIKHLACLRDSFWMPTGLRRPEPPAGGE